MELIYRWKVRPERIPEFFRTLDTTVERLVRAHGELSARIAQPVLGPAGDVWEVAIEVRDMTALGRLLDQEDVRNAPLWELSELTSPSSNRLDGSPPAELLESNAPLYRTWIYRAPPHSSQPDVRPQSASATEQQPSKARGS